MPMSVDIRLPRDAMPVFPDSCCRCLRPRPGEVMSVGAGFSSWWEALFPWLWFLRKRVRHEVPVCRACFPVARRHLLVHRWALFVAVVVALAAVDPLARQFVPDLVPRKLLTTLGVVVAVLPVLLWQMFDPPPFDLTARPREVEFEFANHAYAARFAAANAADPPEED